MQKGKQKFTPTPIRLNELKPLLQREAMEQDRSLNWLVCKIVKDYLSNKQIYSKSK